jgi:hypothetical protein
MPALSADPSDPLSPLVSANGSMLCFRRDYSPKHLAQHPKQTIRSAVLAFQEQGFVTLAVTARTGAPKRIPASCGWRQGAAIDTSDHKMIPDFDKPAGFDCMVTLGDSAQEGGYLLVDPAQDAKSLSVFLQSPIYAYDGKPGKAKGSFVELGPEDRTFALTRIEPKACASFKAGTE